MANNFTLSAFNPFSDEAIRFWRQQTTFTETHAFSGGSLDATYVCTSTFAAFPRGDIMTAAGHLAKVVAYAPGYIEDVISNYWRWVNTAAYLLTSDGEIYSRRATQRQDAQRTYGHVADHDTCLALLLNVDWKPAY